MEGSLPVKMLVRLQKAAVLLNSSSNLQKLTQQCNRGFRNYAPLSCAKKEEKAVAGVPYQNLKIGVPKEVFSNEKRVALTPGVITLLTKKGFTVNVESGAGVNAMILDSDYKAAGANITSKDEAFKSDIVLKVRAPASEEIKNFKPDTTLISFIYPQQNEELVKNLSAQKLQVFAMDKVPRISRAQVFDALSSMAKVSGYKAVLEAANNFGRFFAGLCCFYYIYMQINMQNLKKKKIYIYPVYVYIID